MRTLSIIAAVALAVGATVATPAPAEARTFVSFGVNTGPGYGYYGPRYGYGGGYYGPRYRGGYYDGYYGPRYRGGWDRGYRGWDRGYRGWDRRWDRPRYRYYDRPRRWRNRW